MPVFRVLPELFATPIKLQTLPGAPVYRRMHTAQSIFLMRTMFSPRSQSGKRPCDIFFALRGRGRGRAGALCFLSRLADCSMYEAEEEEEEEEGF